MKEPTLRGILRWTLILTIITGITCGFGWAIYGSFNEASGCFFVAFITGIILEMGGITGGEE